MNHHIATFAAGCFWGVEEIYETTPGVVEAVSGYMGGSVSNPTYEQVCTGTTGHAEAVQVTYDADIISYEDLLKIFWENHDPTQGNRQGPDIGSQYRSVIFFHTPEQQRIAEVSKVAQEASGKYHKPITTEIVPATDFYRAEEYHQQYNKKHGRSCRV